MQDFLRDTRHSIRMFRKSPGFTITAIAAIALGIGATTAIFSIVNAVLLKPLPVFDPDRFVELVVTDGGDPSDGASPAKFMHWRTQTSVLQDVSAMRYGVMNYSTRTLVEQVRSLQASSEIFRCWGLEITRGRAFTAEEDLPGGPLVALIGRELWVRNFAADPQVLGKTINLSGEPYTIIGVVADRPALRELGQLPQVYVPFQLDPNTTDQGAFFQVMARLRPGVTLQQAKARLQASAAAFRARFPEDLGPKGSFTVIPFREAVVGDVRPLLLILLGAVGLVLLIACSNVANLLLAKASGRRHEIAIRAALGAARGRMVRQLLTESVLLSLAGGALGLWLGYGGVRALLTGNTAGIPMIGEKGEALTLDWRIVVFALAVSLVTGIVFGLFPALQASRVDLISVMKDKSGRWGTGLRHNKARSALVVSEVSLAVILLVGSALLIRTFLRLYQVPRGFETTNVVSMRSSLTGPKYAKTAGVALTLTDGLAHLRALPGVVAASAACCLPLVDGTYDLPFDVTGRPPLNGPARPSVGWAAISPGFFDVFRIPVRRGRTFDSRDDGKSPAVVIINERMAALYWKDGDPLRDRLLIGRSVMKEFDNEPVRQIVGIVADVRDEDLSTEPRAIMYVPQAQLPDAQSAWFQRQGPVAWMVRTRAESRGLIPAMREALQQSTGLAVSDVRSMDEAVWASTGRQRFNMLLMTIFGSAALLLAAIGIYGLMAYTVEQRTQEIGIRLALGAGTTDVRNMVVRQGMTLALTGVVVGTGAAWGLARVIQSILFGVKAHDPLVFVGVPFILTLVGLAAVWLPANRASRVDPVVSLRYE